MTRTKDRNAELEERNRVAAARIEQLEEQLASLSRKHVALGRSHRIALATLRFRDRQVAALSDQLGARRVLDTGTPGVEVTR